MKLLLPLALCAGLAAAEPPQLIYGNPHYGHPMWVDVTGALTSEDALREDLFSEGDARELRQALVSAPDSRGCVAFSLPIACGAPSMEPTTVSTVAKTSRVVLSARVVDRSHGFLYGRPGQLLHLRVEDVWKGTGERPGDEIYTAVFVSELDFAGVRLCLRSTLQTPELGDTVIVLGRRSPTLGDDMVFTGDLVTISRRGVVTLPARWPPRAAISEDDVYDALGDVIRE